MLNCPTLKGHKNVVHNIKWIKQAAEVFFERCILNLPKVYKYFDKYFDDIEDFPKGLNRHMGYCQAACLPTLLSGMCVYTLIYVQKAAAGMFAQ